jgi:hypothetical protein
MVNELQLRTNYLEEFEFKFLVKFYLLFSRTLITRVVSPQNFED